MASINMEMSKTYQYRKVMKPMLERKRRARINKCLDELKDLMVAALESEGEHVTRLEKADILELTVTHLQKLKNQRKLNGGNSTMTRAEGFRSGYIYAANEVSQTLSRIPGDYVNLGTQVMGHLRQRLNQIQPPPMKVTPLTPLTNPLSIQCGSYPGSYSVPLSPISSRSSALDSPSSEPPSTKHTELRCFVPEPEENVWRPW